jgi:hypothetical protein
MLIVGGAEDPPRRDHHQDPKLSKSMPTTSRQPSTRTKSISLKGSEIMTGGSINMPMEIVTLAMTISKITKGK